MHTITFEHSYGNYSRYPLFYYCIDKDIHTFSHPLFPPPSVRRQVLVTKVWCAQILMMDTSVESVLKVTTVIC